MGYRGKLDDQQRARELRARSWTLAEIAEELDVSRSSVSVWVRDVDFVPRPRNRGHPAGPKHPTRLRKEAQIERCRAEAAEWGSAFSNRELAMFCLGLYAGEGAKTDGRVSMANTNPLLVRALLAWLRAEFDIDESRLYLHEGLDLRAAVTHWSAELGIPEAQFTRPYRAVADASVRSTKHRFGCVTVAYSDALVHRRVMARIEAITSRFDIPG